MRESWPVCRTEEMAITFYRPPEQGHVASNSRLHSIHVQCCCTLCSDDRQCAFEPKQISTIPQHYQSSHICLYASWLLYSSYQNASFQPQRVRNRWCVCVCVCKAWPAVARYDRQYEQWIIVIRVPIVRHCLSQLSACIHRMFHLALIACGL